MIPSVPPLRRTVDWAGHAPSGKISWRKAFRLLGLFCIGAWLAFGLIVAMVFG